MSAVEQHVNGPHAEMLGDLTVDTEATRFESAVPVLATPAAAAAGVAVGAGLIGAGIAIEEAAEG